MEEVVVDCVFLIPEKTIDYKFVSSKTAAKC